MLVMAGLMMLFYVSGLLGDTLTGTLLNIMFTPQSFADTDFSLYVQIVGAMGTISVVTGLVVGYITKNVELAVMWGVVGWLVAFFSDFFRVFLVVYNANTIIALLLFAPIMLLWYIIILDWWRKVV